MKKHYISIIFIIVFIFTGCSKINLGKEVIFKEFYSGVIGFSKSNKQWKSIPQDAILMLKNQEYQEFKDIYFTKREIPIENPDKQKAVLFIQIPAQSFSVKTYSVTNIKIKENKLIVGLGKSSSAEVDPVAGFDNGVFKWIMLLEVDKNLLNDKTEIIVEK